MIFYSQLHLKRGFCCSCFHFRRQSIKRRKSRLAYRSQTFPTFQNQWNSFETVSNIKKILLHYAWKCKEEASPCVDDKICKNLWLSEASQHVWWFCGMKCFPCIFNALPRLEVCPWVLITEQFVSGDCNSTKKRHSNMKTMSSMHFDKRRRSDDAKKWMWGIVLQRRGGEGASATLPNFSVANSFRMKQRSKDCIKLTHGGAITVLLRFMIVQCTLIWTRKFAPDVLLCRTMMNLDAWRILVAMLSKLKISVRIR